MAVLEVPARRNPRGAPPRSARRDSLLLHRYAKTGDPVLREELVRRYLPLAASVARPYRHSGEAMEDLMQVAGFGLAKALDRFDPERGYSFAGFAVPTIRGELKRHLRDHAWMVRPPRGLQEQALAVERASQRLYDQHGRAPTVEEIGEATGLDAEAVLEARLARQGRYSAPLPEPSDEQAQSASAIRALGREDDGFSLAEDRATIDRLLGFLSPRDREIVRLRFEEDLTQLEIGERLGISQMQISRLLRRILDEVRRRAPAPGDEDGASAGT